MTNSPFTARCSLLAIRYLLFAACFLLRLAALGRYVTPDEPAWVHRSIQFSAALAARDWDAIPSTGHPGVTTMWLGGAGIAVQRWLAPAESEMRLDWLRRMAWLAPENDAAFRHLAYFLSWGRVAVALTTTLGLAALYPLLKRLFGRRAALLATALLAFDPFLIGHSGLLHTDALLATFALLALTAALNGLREPRRPLWWSLAGLFTGLALLTKSPAILLLPFTLLIALIAYGKGRHRDGGHEDAHPTTCYSPTRYLLFAICYLLYVTTTLLVVFALYPRLWTDPAGAAGDLFAFAGKHMEGALRPIFFAGRTTYDPGPAFYPVVFILRASPFVLIGLAVSIFTLPRLPVEQRQAILLLAAFSVAFIALMSLGAKKHDRYILPAILPLGVAAGIGMSRLGRGKAGDRICYLLFAMYALAFAARPLSASNLLIGGPWTARRVIELDWGEWMGAAARQLNRRPDAERLTVAALAVPSFAALFEGHTVPLTQASLADSIVLQSPAEILTNTLPTEQAAFLAARAAADDLILLDADAPLLHRYAGPAAILSAADWPDPAAHIAPATTGRARIWLISDPAAAPITAAQLRRALTALAAPVSTTTISASVITEYAILTPTEPPGDNAYPVIANFNQQIYLLDALPPEHPVNGPIPIHLRWRAPAPTPLALHASLYLRDAAGRAWAETGQPILNKTYFPTPSWAPGDWADGVWILRPPSTTPPGEYTVEVIVADESGAQLGVWNGWGLFLGTRARLGRITLAPPDAPLGAPPCAGREMSAAALTACLPPWATHAVPSGDALTLPLVWTASAAPQADYQARWRLDGAAEYILPLSPYPTSRWRAGDSFESRYELRLDPAVPAAAYTLTLNVLAPDGRPLWLADEPVARVEILPRERRFDLPADIAHPLTFTLGGVIHLRGCDLPRTAAAPAETLPLTLYWQADGPTDLSYTVFVHLVGPDGQNHGQVDYLPGGGASPTSSWVAGQVIVDEIALPVATDAPPGVYRIAVGMYDAASGGRPPVADAAGNPSPDGRAFLPLEITIAGAAP